MPHCPPWDELDEKRGKKHRQSSDCRGHVARTARSVATRAAPLPRARSGGRAMTHLRGERRAHQPDPRGRIRCVAASAQSRYGSRRRCDGSTTECCGRQSCTIGSAWRTSVNAPMSSLEGAPQGFRESDAGAPRRFVLDPRRMLRRWSGRDPRPSERTAPVVAGQVTVCLVVGLALTGCGAGQMAQTATQQAAADGASGDAGDDIALRDVLMPSSPNPAAATPSARAFPCWRRSSTLVTKPTSSWR